MNKESKWQRRINQAFCNAAAAGKIPALMLAELLGANPAQVGQLAIETAEQHGHSRTAQWLRTQIPG